MAKSKKSKKAKKGRAKPRAAAKRRKMPKAVLARFAAWRAKHRPRVELDGVNLVRKHKHSKRSRKISRAVAAAVRAASKGTKHGDVRFNPSKVRQALVSAFKRGKAAFQKEIARQKKLAGRQVVLDGKVMQPGAERMKVIRAVIEATKAKHGTVKWNPTLTQREAMAVLRKAKKAKRKTGRKQTKFKLPSGRWQTTSSAALRWSGKHVNRRGKGLYETRKGRKVVMRSASAGGGGGGSGGAYDPLADLDMV